jgi:hypothetical protein
MDRKRTVETVAAAAVASGTDRAVALEKIRRLARRGIIELVSASR